MKTIRDLIKIKEYNQKARQELLILAGWLMGIYDADAESIYRDVKGQLYLEFNYLVYEHMHPTNVISDIKCLEYVTLDFEGQTKYFLTNMEDYINELLDIAKVDSFWEQKAAVMNLKDLIQVKEYNKEAYQELLTLLHLIMCKWYEGDLFICDSAHDGLFWSDQEPAIGLEEIVKTFKYVKLNPKKNVKYYFNDLLIWLEEAKRNCF